MPEDVQDRIIHAVENVSDLYYRLVLLVGRSGAGKTRAFYELSARKGFKYLNLSLELSLRLLDLPSALRPVAVRRLVEELMNGDTGPVLCDNIELLFDVSLKQEPLHLLQLLSRKRTIVAAWNGTLADGFLYYAEPDHPEYRRYAAEDVLVIPLDEAATQ